MASMPNILYQVSLDMVPPTATHHSKQIVTIKGSPRLIDRKALRVARQDYAALIQGTYTGEPIDSPVALLMRFVFPYPAATPKKVTKDGAQIWKPTKPDLSNLVKTPEDVLSECGILANDSRVVAKAELKCYGPKPCVDIVLIDMEGMGPAHAWSLFEMVLA